MNVTGVGWHALSYSATPKGVRKRRTTHHLQQGQQENILACIRIVDPETGKSYVEKRRVRYNEPGQPRELRSSYPQPRDGG
jgi:hypothetical protein